MSVTDEKGSIVETYAYTAYGELVDGQYRDDIPFLYNGQYGVTTDGNGLYYMRARYYNVDIKRFINQDVLLGVLERISSLNRYAYVEGNPVNYLDPFGLAREDRAVWHKRLAVIGSITSILTFLPGWGGDIAKVFSVIFDVSDILLSIYDFTDAMDAGDTDGMIISAFNISSHIITATTTLLGFKIDAFYNTISSFTGWGNAKAFLYSTEIAKNAYDYYSIKIGANALAATLTALILDCLVVNN